MVLLRVEPLDATSSDPATRLHEITGAWRQASQAFDELHEAVRGGNPLPRQGLGACLGQLVPAGDAAYEQEGFHPAARLALDRVVALRPEEVVALDLYTDGTGAAVELELSR